MAINYKYSNNSGKTINIFVPRGIYYKIKNNHPKGINLDVSYYHPKNQIILYSEDPFKNFKLSTGETVIFTPEEDADGTKNNFFHGYFVVDGFFKEEGELKGGHVRKTRSILERYSSEIPF
ncbi:MAG: hypothetical protein AABW81_03135 [Nanoarchaeota archaeon]